MNEHIQVLLAQAGILQPERFDTIDGGNQLEKFTELLVNKCIHTIQLGMSRDGYDTKHYKQSLKHIEMIKEHFRLQ